MTGPTLYGFWWIGGFPYECLMDFYRFVKNIWWFPRDLTGSSWWFHGIRLAGMVLSWWFDDGFIRHDDFCWDLTHSRIRGCSDSLNFLRCLCEAELSLQSGALFAGLIFQKCSGIINFEVQIGLSLHFCALSDLIFQKCCGVITV